MVAGSAELRIADALERLGQAQRVLMQDRATDEGLSPLQVRILLSLAQAPARPSELAARLGVTRATLTDTLKALRARGLAQQSTMPSDRRSRVAELSGAGRSAAERLVDWGMPVTRRIADLPTGTQGALLPSLLELLAGLQADGLIPPARMCLTCRFFRPAVSTQSPAGPGWCDLLESPLAPVDLRLDCAEHEAAAG